MDANDKNDGQKPEVYKIVTLGQGNVNRREFVKSLAVATGVAVVAMGAGDSEAQAKNRAGAAVNQLLLDDGADPCSLGCLCHMVCATQSVGTCACEVVRSTCAQSSNGQSQVYNQVQEFNGIVCNCNRVSVCTCDTVCTCNTMCTCENVCSCHSYNACGCQCVSNSGYYISYWYPN